MQDPQDQSKIYKDNCGIVRQGHIVRDTGTNDIVFDGGQEIKQYTTFPPKDDRENFRCVGINAAKRYVRKSGTQSYNA